MHTHYQKLVTHHIPLTDYMGWSIQSLDGQAIHTACKLAPNINVHGTAYAGSIYAASMATGWTLLKCWSDQSDYQADLVAAEANIKYLQPVQADFECKANLQTEAEQYLKLLRRAKDNKSCGFIQSVDIFCQDKLCAILSINFVFKC